MELNQTLVSVIVPTYNSAHYIQDALQSLFAQSHRKLEIIIVDDGSTDNTKEVISPFLNDSRIKYIFQENRGPAAARNTGIRAANGEYVCFLDSDDIYLPASIEERLDIFDRYPHTNMAFTDLTVVQQRGPSFTISRESYLYDSGLMQSIDNKSIDIVDEKIYVFNAKIFYELIVHCFIWTGTVIIRRSLFDTIGLFDEDLKIAEDHDLWLRIAKKHTIALKLTKTGIYRINENSITENIPLYCDFTINLRRKLLENEMNIPKTYITRLKKYIARLYARKGYYYLGGLDHPKAKSEYLQAIQFCPILWKIYPFAIMSALPVDWVRQIRQWKRSITSTIKPLARSDCNRSGGTCS